MPPPERGAALAWPPSAGVASSSRRPSRSTAPRACGAPPPATALAATVLSACALGLGRHHQLPALLAHAAVLQQRPHLGRVQADAQVAVGAGLQGQQAGGPGSLLRGIGRVGGRFGGGDQAGHRQQAVGGDCLLPGRGEARGRPVEGRPAGQLQAGGHQVAHVDPRAGRHQHPGGVEQEDMAVAGQLAGDARGGAAQHPVERHRRGVRLHEAHRRVGADVEAAPLQHRARGALGDGQGAVLAGQLGVAGGHPAVLGQCVARLAPGQCRQPGQQAQRGGVEGQAESGSGAVAHGGLRAGAQRGKRWRRLNHSCGARRLPSWLAPSKPPGLPPSGTPQARAALKPRRVQRRPRPAAASP